MADAIVYGTLYMYGKLQESEKKEKRNVPSRPRKKKNGKGGGTALGPDCSSVHLGLVGVYPDTHREKGLFWLVLY